MNGAKLTLASEVAAGVHHQDVKAVVRQESPEVLEGMGIRHPRGSGVEEAMLQDHRVRMGARPNRENADACPQMSKKGVWFDASAVGKEGMPVARWKAAPESWPSRRAKADASGGTRAADAAATSVKPVARMRAQRILEELKFEAVPGNFNLQNPSK